LYFKDLKAQEHADMPDNKIPVGEPTSSASSFPGYAIGLIVALVILVIVAIVGFIFVVS